MNDIYQITYPHDCALRLLYPGVHSVPHLTPADAIQPGMCMSLHCDNKNGKRVYGLFEVLDKIKIKNKEVYGMYTDAEEPIIIQNIHILHTLQTGDLRISTLKDITMYQDIGYTAVVEATHMSSYTAPLNKQKLYLSRIADDKHTTDFAIKLTIRPLFDFSDTLHAFDVATEHYVVIPVIKDQTVLHDRVIP